MHEDGLLEKKKNRNEILLKYQRDILCILKTDILFIFKTL